MSQKLKVVTIGGGSSYTPELLEGFIKRYHELPVSELWLVDVEGGKAKLDIIFDLCQRMIDNAGVPMKLYKTLDRREALKDADFVTTQLRVGQLPARELDERIPLSHGYLGQETNGAGGLFKGLRTIPVIFDIVKDVEELCPNAWVINFTNPAGMVTEAVYRHTGFKRFIGVCNIPIGMKMFIRDVLMLKDSDDLSIDLFGLNHMVFIKDVLVNGKSRFAELLDGVASGQLKASGVKNIFDLPFSEGLIRSMNLLPCSYLLYYFKQKEMLAIEMGEYYKGGARAQVVQKVEKQLFELYKNPELNVKPKELEQRGGAYYSDAACEVINAIYNDKQAEHYVNIPHHGHIDNIPADWAVEMTCTLGRDGATPHPRITHFDDKVMGLAPLAGAQPPNVIIGTIVGTAFAITTGVKPDVAVGVAVPFAVAVQMGITFLFSVMSGVMSRCDRMAENADTRGIERVNYLALLALGTFYFLCAFLPIYFGAEHAKTIIDVLPQRLIDGLGVAGGIMPAIGFAVLLKIMMKNVYIPYFILGFVAAAWLKLPVLAIAAAALAMALIDLLRKSPEPTQPAAQKEEFEDGI